MRISTIPGPRFRRSRKPSLRALEKTTITTTGEVKLDPQAAVKLDANGAQVKVDPTSTIRLDASGTVVLLDPNAVVNVRGVTSEAPRPTPLQLNSNTVPHSPKVNVVTNYIVFKNVPRGKGAVVTGWLFTSNEDDSPRSEYCYYQEPIRDGVRAQFDLARDGQLLKSDAPATFDRKSAAADCVWFGGGPTRSF
jgi:hypothetical protein